MKPARTRSFAAALASATLCFAGLAAGYLAYVGRFLAD